MDYLSAKFGNFSFSRDWFYRADRQTDRITDRITEADDCYYMGGGYSRDYSRRE